MLLDERHAPPTGNRAPCTGLAPPRAPPGLPPPTSRRAPTPPCRLAPPHAADPASPHAPLNAAPPCACVRVGAVQDAAANLGGERADGAVLAAGLPDTAQPR
eukprot:1620959-Prymnesium_polylepis.1